MTSRSPSLLTSQILFEASCKSILSVICSVPSFPSQYFTFNDSFFFALVLVCRTGTLVLPSALTTSLSRLEKICQLAYGQVRIRFLHCCFRCAVYALYGQFLDVFNVGYDPSLIRPHLLTPVIFQFSLTKRGTARSFSCPTLL